MPIMCGWILFIKFLLRNVIKDVRLVLDNQIIAYPVLMVIIRLKINVLNVQQAVRPALVLLIVLIA